MKRKLQIGVMGSAADTKNSKKNQLIAENIGKEVAKTGSILVYGAEKDVDSLSTSAAKGAKEENGLVVGITYGKGKEVWGGNKYADVVICSGMERGGGREFVLVNSCDGIITVSGGSGTLNEMLVAYQLHIPIVAIKGTGGSSDMMVGKYLDSRKRMKVESASSPEDAVKKILKLINQKNP